MTTDTVLDDPVLVRLGAALRAAYGPRLERALLFGSRARGDAHAESDYDVAVFLHDMTSRWTEMTRLGDIAVEIMDTTGAVLNMLPLAPEALEQRTMLMHEIRKDGRDLP